MKTTLAFLLLATTAGAFEFRITALREGHYDATPANPFDGSERIFVIETFHADANPFLLDVLRWDYVAEDGTVIGAVTPYTVDLPFVSNSGPGFAHQYRTTADSATPWGEEIRWEYDDFPRAPDLLRYSPASGERVTNFDVTTGNGRYDVNINTNRYHPIPEPAAHVLLALLGLLAWCVARKGRI